jgi:hypothetical protein
MLANPLPKATVEVRNRRSQGGAISLELKAHRTHKVTRLRYSAARFAATLLSLCFASLPASCQSRAASADEAAATVAHLQDFPIIEFRRYTIKEGEREHFATYFDSFFPEAFEQLGAIAVGQFLERDKPLGLTWIRGFHNMDDRARINAAFYYGPVWKEHKNRLNGLMTDNDKVLLLRSLPNRALPVYSAVDPVAEADGAKGIVIAEIFAVKANSIDSFVSTAESSFAQYRSAGVREAGVLTTLEATNNFPQLPIRTDGPYVVWLGIAQDAKSLESSFVRVSKQAGKSLSETGLLRSDPEIVILEPTHRSRLRWR